MTKGSVYMRWAKEHAAARYNLANSGLLPCGAGDLVLEPEDVLVNGANRDGYPPLLEAIAARYGVVPEQVVTASGASGANFLALAALVTLLFNPAHLFDTGCQLSFLAVAAVFWGIPLLSHVFAFSRFHLIDRDGPLDPLDALARFVRMRQPRTAWMQALARREEQSYQANDAATIKARNEKMRANRTPETATFPPEQERLYGLRLDGVWMHVGTPDAVNAAEEAFLESVA